MRRRRVVRAVTAAFLLALQVGGCGGAWSPGTGITPAVSRGATVRVQVRDTAARERRSVQYRGVLTDVSEDSLGLETGDGLLRIAKASVVRMDALDGTHGHALTGLALGLLIGGASAGILAATAQDEPCIPPPGAYEAYCGDPGNAVMAVYAVAGLVFVGGALIGTVVGAMARSERWREVPLDRLPEPTRE